MRSVKQIYSLGFASDEIENILSLVLRGESLANLYLIMVGSKQEDAFAIYPSWMNTSYDLEEELLVGLADGRDKAFSLVESIVSDIYKATHNIDVKDYFKDK
ncbi:MAG: hypothetical protein K6G01_03220 [Eubacterium sp.]|nr:hypothetical protein [Eubacterium sp.]